MFERRSCPKVPKSKSVSIDCGLLPTLRCSSWFEGLRGGGGMAGMVGTSSLFRSKVYLEFAEVFETE